MRALRRKRCCDACLCNIPKRNHEVRSRVGTGYWSSSYHPVPPVSTSSWQPCGNETRRSLCREAAGRAPDRARRFGALFGLAIAVVCSGTYIAIQEIVERSAVAELLPRDQRSFGFGVLACTNAVGDMVSGLYVGALLAADPRAWAFGRATGFGPLSTIWILRVGRKLSSDAISNRRDTQTS